MNNIDILKASAIAGGSIGFAGGFLNSSQRLEENGNSPLGQVIGGLGTGLLTGAAGVGIGIGASSTAAALKGILKR